MQIIKHRKHVTVVSYFHSFDYEGTENHGFAFDCNERGVVCLKSAASQANYEACLAGFANGSKVVDRGIKRREHSYFESAEGRCSCGRTVALDSSWANTCDCGREYNGSGQLLAARSQWGEETGEQF
jgi:hypothetical protein